MTKKFPYQRSSRKERNSSDGVTPQCLVAPDAPDPNPFTPRTYKREEDHAGLVALIYRVYGGVYGGWVGGFSMVGDPVHLAA